MGGDAHVWFNSLAIFACVIALLVLAMDVRQIKKLCEENEKRHARRDQEAAREAEAAYHRRADQESA